MTANKQIGLRTLVVGIAGVLSAAAILSSQPPGTSPGDVASGGLPALDYAFRFASAIASDPKDRAKAQELALEGFAAAGAFDEAAKRAEQIDGWRRGIVYADIAVRLASVGRKEEALAFVQKAESVRVGVEGWQNPRIAARVAEAHAALGDAAQAGTMAADLATADPVQYAGHAAAVDAVGLAARGNFDEAMRRLDDLEGNPDLDVAWSRTTGYLALSRRQDASEAQRLAALRAARTAAGKLPIERQVEGLLQVATEFQAQGRRSESRKIIQGIDKAVRSAPMQGAEILPYLIEIGRAWAGLGEPDKARGALAEAQTMVPKALSIDQPGLLARIASAYRKIPDVTRAQALDEQALDVAARMPLSRPRALEIAAICRQLGQDGVAPDQALRVRLDGLLAGLGDPW